MIFYITAKGKELRNCRKLFKMLLSQFSLPHSLVKHQKIYRKLPRCWVSGKVIICLSHHSCRWIFLDYHLSTQLYANKLSSTTDVYPSSKTSNLCLPFSLLNHIYRWWDLGVKKNIKRSLYDQRREPLVLHVHNVRIEFLWWTRCYVIHQQLHGWNFICYFCLFICLSPSFRGCCFSSFAVYFLFFFLSVFQ